MVMIRGVVISKTMGLARQEFRGEAYGPTLAGLLSLRDPMTALSPLPPVFLNGINLAVSGLWG